MVLIAAALIYAVNFGWHKFTRRNTAGTSFATQTVNDLTITLSSPGGQLKKGDNDVLFMDVARAIDIMRGAGIDKIGLITAKLEAGQ